MECKHINYVSTYKYWGVTMVEIGSADCFQLFVAFVVVVLGFFLLDFATQLV